jgi:hypothetical protein
MNYQWYRSMNRMHERRSGYQADDIAITEINSLPIKARDISSIPIKIFSRLDLSSTRDVSIKSRRLQEKSLAMAIAGLRGFEMGSHYIL